MMHRESCWETLTRCVGRVFGWIAVLVWGVALGGFLAREIRMLLEGWKP